MSKKLVIILIAALLIACKKSKMKKDIAGTWEYEVFIGEPFTAPILPPGNGNIIVIKKNGTFERWKHDTLVFRGSYSLKRKDDCHPRESDIRFTTNEPNSTESYVDVVDEKLTLSTPNCNMDGGITFYRRIQ